MIVLMLLGAFFGMLFRVFGFAVRIAFWPVRVLFRVMGGLAYLAIALMTVLAVIFLGFIVII